ncbi:hypothetical protein F2Q68_00037448 [Brassica cretica]|uniref:Uncharacterized protein n=1 Tax=Brassica cretica TaxID=69181 RepID=A0A8S9H0J4_BRACR|nr:hypothetical protein F2Q68_00037448 [Brassica cretica]
MVGNFLHYISRFIAGFAIGFTSVWQISLVTLAIVPLIALAGGIYAFVAIGLIARVRKSYIKAGQVAEEVIGNVRTVQAFTGEERAAKLYREVLKNTYKYGRKAGLIKGLGLGSLHCVLFLSWALLVWFTSVVVHKGIANAGESFTTMLNVVIAGLSLGQAAPDVSAFVRAKAAAYPIFQMIERDTAAKTSAKSGRKLSKVDGHIQFTDVTFSYPSRPDVLIFDKLNLAIPAGKMVALVGGSGSGKSTVISLIERFYEPTSGAVLLDGNDIRELDIKWLRGHIGLVSQEPALFATTIRENIMYGKVDATDEEVGSAAKLSEAFSFINNLPEGFETQVGDRGIQLSGGQKQRIAISRAILKNPSILLLDEATSALDAESEKSVQGALERVMVGRTTLVVAHRLSTVRNADVIAVVHEGKIVEFGNHENLISNPDGTYSALLRLQEAASLECNPSLDRTLSRPHNIQYSREQSRTSSCLEKESVTREEGEGQSKEAKVTMRRLYSMIRPDWMAAKLYREVLKNTYKYGRKAGLIKGLGLGSLHCVLFLSWALLVWFTSVVVHKGIANAGESFTTMLNVVIAGLSLGQAAPDVSAFVRAKAAAYPIFQMIERDTAAKTSAKSGRKLSKVDGHIQFTDVTFSYPSRPDVLIFDKLNLAIPAGKMVALVGGSGSGKSTVISLIERFYEPTSGAVLLDGNDIRELDIKWLRGHIGLVSQEPALFATTIRENIMYGKDDATDEEIGRAAKLSEAFSFINNLPEGFETQVGERGIQLSGGQKQRIAISRAILKNPSILLLDEATSALDAELEKSVQEALERVMVGKTTVVVAHRLSTVRNADIIAVVHEGKIIEFGNHENLISNPDGAYSALLRLQETASLECNPSLDRTLSRPHSIQYSREQSRTSSCLEKESVTREDGEDQSKEAKVTMRRLYSMIRPDWMYGICGTLCAFIAGSLMPLTIVLYKNENFQKIGGSSKII